MAIEHRCQLQTISTVCDVMYGPCSQEEHTADSQVGEQHEEPDSWREGIEEGEVTRLPTLVQREIRRREESREKEQHRQTVADRQTGRYSLLENKVSGLSSQRMSPLHHRRAVSFTAL